MYAVISMLCLVATGHLTRDTRKITSTYFVQGRGGRGDGQNNNKGLLMKEVIQLRDIPTLELCSVIQV